MALYRQIPETVARFSKRLKMNEIVTLKWPVT